MNRKKNANGNQTMVKLGKIGITPAGEYDAGKTYDKLCLVLGADGNSYLSTQESVTGIEPGVTEGWENYWQFLCGSGKGGGVQSDYAQNDEAQLDYIKNRPGGYYQTVPAVDIQWDGVVGDRPNVDADGMILVKVSDEILTTEQMIGATATMVQGSENQSKLVTENDIMSGDGFVAAFIQTITSFSKTTIEGLTVPETGTYFAYMEQDGETTYISGLTKPESQELVPIPGELTNIKGGYDLPGKTEELYSGTIAADSWIEKGTSSQNLESDVAVQKSTEPSTYFEAPITLAAELTDGATITGTVAGTKVSGEFWDGSANLYTVNNGSRAARASGGGRSLVCVITQNSIQVGSAPETNIEVQLTQIVEGGPVVIPAEYLDTAALETSISNAQNTADSAATKTNPVFTGIFSQNRKPGTASGHSSHAEGDNTTASGYSSHAEGDNTTASGQYSHAEGSYTQAIGENSHAEGVGTIAQGYGQHVEGCYNVAQGKNNSHTESDYVHIVGNGSSNSARYNTHTLTFGGVPWYQGRPRFGGTAMNNGAQTVVGNGDKEIILASSALGSTKKFKITVDDSGTLSATEVTS